jgi:hypothetical protein
MPDNWIKLFFFSSAETGEVVRFIQQRDFFKTIELLKLTAQFIHSTTRWQAHPITAKEIRSKVID